MNPKDFDYSARPRYEEGDVVEILASYHQGRLADIVTHNTESGYVSVRVRVSENRFFRPVVVVLHDSEVRMYVPEIMRYE